MLGLGVAGDERPGQFGADLGVPLLGLEDELLQAPGWSSPARGLEVVPAAFQVAVVRVEQAPRALALGIGFDERGDGGRGRP